MRRRFFIIILLAAIILPVVSVYAQTTPGTTGVTSGFKALAPIPGLTGDASGQTTSVLSSKSLAEFFNNLYIYAIGLAAAIAVIQIIYAGLEIAFFNKDSVSKLMDSKGRIAQSIYGLILIFSPVVVFSIINPSILNLELNMQPLDTANGTATSGGGGATEEPVISQFECTTLHSGPYLENATCPAKALAVAYVCKNSLQKKIALKTCERANAATGVCEEPVQVVCEGKREKVVYYGTYDSTPLIGDQWEIPSTILPGEGKVIPRDAAKEAAFIAGCSADKGRTYKGIPLDEGPTDFYTCPLAEQLPPYNPREVTGYNCGTVELSCSNPL